MDTDKLKELVSSLVPNLRFEEEITRGGQKTVFKGRLGDESVVIKLVSPSNKTEKARALREIEISSSFDSPHFAKLHDFGDFDSNGQSIIYLIEEFVEGESLRKIISKLKPNLLPKVQTKRIIRSLLDALLLVENDNLVHRDIKPENIMVGRERIVLIDFGIARHLDLNSLTKTFAPFGPMTPGYAAPEQIRNQKRKISIRTDLFSVGVLFYELLIGENPFRKEGSSVEETLQNTLNLDPEPLSGEGYDPAVDDFLRTCLDKSCHRRPAAVEMAIDLFSKINWEKF